MAISAKEVSALREKTGAGMMDCKRALTEANGDMEKALDVLRKNGMAKAEKKSGRATHEGKIVAKVEGNKAAMVEILCETDFVAKNEKFQGFCNEILADTLQLDGDGCVTEKLQAEKKDVLTNMIATIGENMQLRRAAKWETTGKVATYLHMGGRIGVIVEVEGEVSDETMNALCMHIAAFRPEFICSGCIPEDRIAHEKEIAAAQIQGKPAAMVEKIVGGKINKWFTEVCLINQPWILDDKTSFAKLNPKAVVKRFLRWEVGEEL